MHDVCEHHAYKYTYMYIGLLLKMIYCLEALNEKCNNRLLELHFTYS